MEAANTYRCFGQNDDSYYFFNALNHYRVSAVFNSCRLSPLAMHRVRFDLQNHLMESADCNGENCPTLTLVKFEEEINYEFNH